MKVLYNFLILCIFNVSLSKSKHKKETRENGSSEGDKLIEKILSADKFDDLADKIVDKAIRKLNHIKPSSDIARTRTPKAGKHSAPDNSPSLDTREERSNKRDQKRHKTAIDVEAVLKTKVIPLADLSFRYEHFMKGSNSVIAKPAKKTKILRKDSLEESTEKNPTKLKEVQKSNENSTEIQDENDKLKKNLSGETSNVDENKIHTENVSNIIINSTNEDEFTKPKLQNAENQFGDEKVIVWGEKDDSGNDSEKNDEKKGKENDEKISSESDDTDDPYHKRAEAKKKASPLSSKHNDADNRINKYVLKDKELRVKRLQLEHDEILKKSKNLIRREGDKKYTFEESPDYADYHEKLAEFRKSQNKISA